VTRDVHPFSTQLEQTFQRYPGAKAACLEEIALDIDRPEPNLTARVE
jgi:hypothetical protein